MAKWQTCGYQKGKEEGLALLLHHLVQAVIRRHHHLSFQQWYPVEKLKPSRKIPEGKKKNFFKIESPMIGATQRIGFETVLWSRSLGSFSCKIRI